MVLINKAINEVTVKLVYYGPGLCGKTTNLEKIYGNPKLENKGKMISMSTETDRTLFFDFMPMELGTIGGQKVRVQIYTVPGQVFYDATRKLVLRGADGVVFVADSQASMKESNLDSLENLKTNLRINRIDPDKVALVFQYNKRDLPGVSTVEEMSEYMKPGNAPIVEAAAISGVGVTATLRAAVTRILDNLKHNVDVTLYEEAPLSAPDMSARAGVTYSSAGTPKLSMRTEGGTTSTTTRASQPAPAAPQRPAPAPAPAPTPAAPAADLPPFAAPVQSQEDDADPFGDVSAAPASAQSHQDDPFGAHDIEPQDDPFAAAVAVAEPELPGTLDPFAPAATASSDTSVRSDIEMMLASARSLVASIEQALERAREQERALQKALDALK
jgi:signal recognition particle receptor subunit beta